MAALRFSCRTLKHIGGEGDKNYNYAINEKIKIKRQKRIPMGRTRELFL